MSEGATYAPSPTDIAWAAGLFEGEGAIVQRGRRHGVYTYLQVKMSDRDTVEHFARIVGCGTVREAGWEQSVRGTKLLFVWQTGAWADVQRIINDFLPYFMLRRRKRAVKALNEDVRA
jgi:hypothetical protein